jgi:hypothetical protein
MLVLVDLVPAIRIRPNKYPNLNRGRQQFEFEKESIVK